MMSNLLCRLLVRSAAVVCINGGKQHISNKERRELFGSRTLSLINRIISCRAWIWWQAVDTSPRRHSPVMGSLDHDDFEDCRCGTICRGSGDLPSLCSAFNQKNKESSIMQSKSNALVSCQFAFHVPIRLALQEPVNGSM